jgi:hypothetical protein
MKCFIVLPLLIHIELLWRSRSFKNRGAGVWVKVESFKNWEIGVGVGAFVRRLHSPAKYKVIMPGSCRLWLPPLVHRPYEHCEIKSHLFIMCCIALSVSHLWKYASDFKDQVKVHFCPMPPECWKQIAFWKTPRIRSIAVLERVTCRWRRVRSIGGMILTGKNENTGRKTCPSTRLCTKTPTWTERGSKLCLRVETPATNRLSHGAASV